MRLIDAEPLVAISWKAHKDETYERGFEDGVCYALDRIEQAHIIDAIPVGWLEQQFYDNPKSQWAEKCRDVYTKWKKEQGAR